ncbi:MAG TPA: PPOX class F420-dependent oxidoreductase [Actinomycetota bacterium]|jgi:PPOX class probable F420-dependent enzyme
MLTENDRQLLRGKNYAQFVTLNPDGTPQATPIWIDADDEGNVVVNTAVGRRKDRNARRDPRVAVSLFASDDPLTYLSVNGTVVRRVDEPEALAHIDALSRRYDDKPWRPVEGQRRVMLLIRPDHVLRGD